MVLNALQLCTSFGLLKKNFIRAPLVSLLSSNACLVQIQNLNPGIYDEFSECAELHV